MFTRHLFVAAALMAATLSAQAGAISSSPEALGTTAAASTSLASDMSIVDASATLSSTGLANILASSDSQQQFSLFKGVEGLYMLASRVNAPLDAGTGGVATPTDTSPALDASAVPEPSSVALMLAGMLGAVGFTRGRKRG
jgi:hypothetical protein